MATANEGNNADKLDRQELSSIWKDGGNERFGIKFDLIKHLLTHREDPQWVACKERLLKVLALEESNAPICVLELGSGLGIDTLAMAQALGKSVHGGKVVGVDMNTTMLTYARGTAAEAKLPSNVTLEYIQADLTALSVIPDLSYDVVRCDITLQHVNVDAALKEIARILKPGGRLVTLEGTAGGFYAKDDVVRSTYNRFMPVNPTGGTSVQIYFKVQEHGFSVAALETFALTHTGASLARSDPDWIKLKGMAAMLVEKKLLSEEEAADYVKRYIEATASGSILSLGFLMIQVSQKK